VLNQILKYIKFDNDYNISQKLLLLLQETTLQKHLEVTKKLQIFLLQFREFGPWRST
jgi:hypothetical protein